ncbi:MAG: sigma-70 family RNA polymerase sigma factor [Clostridia bacterium]|nr:sigma-70 family RNA polymerase sigma factor [Clostridia bacterium]
MMLQIFLLTIETEEDKLIFNDIYERYKNATMRRALKLLNHNPYDAEDAFQTAWLQIAQNISQIQCREDAAIATYIMKTVEYKAIDVANSNHAYNGMLEPIEYNPKEYVSDDLMYLVCSRERHETIVKVIHNMDDKYKDIMIMAYLQGFDAKSIAEQLNINEKTVWTRLYRGKNILVEELKQRGIHHG